MKMTAGSASGMGRIQKIKAYGSKPQGSQGTPHPKPITPKMPKGK